MLDHDTDSYYKISRAFVESEPVGGLTRDSVVDNVTLYWLTGTGASAARWYWEFGQVLAKAGATGAAPPPVAVPVAFTTFRGEIWAAPRSWVEIVYPGLAYFNEVGRGGHDRINALNVWCGIGSSQEAARHHVAAGMEAFYQLPYERFEKWSPAGEPAQIAEFLAPYLDAGCSVVNLILQGESAEAEIDGAAEIRDHLLRA